MAQLAQDVKAHLARAQRHLLLGTSLRPLLEAEVLARFWELLGRLRVLRGGDAGPGRDAGPDGDMEDVVVRRQLKSHFRWTASLGVYLRLRIPALPFRVPAIVARLTCD
jgi:hypothetical protein